MKNAISYFLIILVVLTGYIVRAQHFTNYTSVDGLPSDYVTGVAVDANNHKWFSTQAGVARFNDTTWITYTTSNGLIDNYVNCIAVDANNHIWIGTDLGVSTFDGTLWTSFTPADGLVNSVVNYIAGAPDGSVWIGTGAGVSHFDGITWNNYTTANGLPNNLISCIAVEQTGSVWLGTWIGGLSKFNGSTFTNYTKTDSLPDNNISAIAIGANNTKWMGTYYGASVFNSTDQWVANYRTKDGLFNNFVMDIDMDSKGTMWFGNYDIYTMDPGLTKKSSTGWRTFNISDGLINAPVKRIAVDKTDHIWVATGAGVSKLTDANAGVGDFSTLRVAIYPNPATTEIHVDGLKTSGTYTILNMAGKEIMGNPLLKGTNTINVENLKTGIYVIRCTMASGVYTEKLIIR
jgi:ligand-binding sensor domain-containing protein